MDNGNGNRPLSVGSLFANISALLREQIPRSADARLGARWSFVVPEADCPLVEYSLPIGPTPYSAALEERTGVRIVEHPACHSGALYDRVHDRGAAIAVVDSFFLSFRPAFGRVHSHRTVIVRRPTQPGHVWIDDPWPPCFSGPVPDIEFERARHSSVPLDETKEPVFAGHAIDGEWFSVEPLPLRSGDIATWVRALISLLHTEATTTSTDRRGSYGITALHRFAQDPTLCSTDRSPCSLRRRRRASLLLRSELASRVYLCAFLRSAARWLQDSTLAEAAFAYERELRAMEMARDVLIKTLVQPRPEYGPVIAMKLRQALTAEEQLAERLAPYSLFTAEHTTGGSMLASSV